MTAAEVELIRRWIKQGANYDRHWSYQPPQRPELPAVDQKDWPRNAIDHFILARLEAKGMRPAAEADRLTLARRLSLDLTGLPPTWEEATAFADDPRENAYELYVDQLLSRQTFGERWARVWLDLARYADSAGYAEPCHDHFSMTREQTRDNRAGNRADELRGHCRQTHLGFQWHPRRRAWLRVAAP